MECFGGVKQLKIAKRKVELKEKNMTVWSWTKKMCLGQFDLEINRETASEMASLPWSQNNRKKKRSSYKGKYERTGDFLKLLHVSS